MEDLIVFVPRGGWFGAKRIIGFLVICFCLQLIKFCLYTLYPKMCLITDASLKPDIVWYPNEVIDILSSTTSNSFHVSDAEMGSKHKGKQNCPPGAHRPWEVTMNSEYEQKCSRSRGGSTQYGDWSTLSLERHIGKEPWRPLRSSLGISEWEACSNKKRNRHGRLQ